MCGIAGSTGIPNGIDVTIAGLKKLEYRGYDSGGVAFVGGSDIRVIKRAGRLRNLERAVKIADVPVHSTCIGHTRWATHGAPTELNAHPHLDPDGTVAVVHNGIIENIDELLGLLPDSGRRLMSDTDTEIIAQLLAAELRAEQSAGGRSGGWLAAAMRRVCGKIAGSFALVALHVREPETLVGARRDSPLLVGLGDRANFIGSDSAVFAERTRRVLDVGQDQVVEMTSDSVLVTDSAGREVSPREYLVNRRAEGEQVRGHANFMRKEMAEQSAAIADTIEGWIDPRGGLRVDQAQLPGNVLEDFRKVTFVGCGSAFHAALTVRNSFEKWSGLPCEIELASEFRYRDPMLDGSDLVVAISQSGETADTLAAVRLARSGKAAVLAVTNSRGSIIAREADAVIFTEAGPEISVASTKAFTTQLVACYLLALQFGLRRPGHAAEALERVRQLAELPRWVERTRAAVEAMSSRVAEAVRDRPNIIFLGRQEGYALAKEGALKVKELVYSPAEAFAAGELKHGPIALVEQGTPVVAVLPPLEHEELRAKMISNLREVRDRGASVIGIADARDEAAIRCCDHVLALPGVPEFLYPVAAAIPLQLIACELAERKGCDVDMPRNLAKAVTVE